MLLAARATALLLATVSALAQNDRDAWRDEHRATAVLYAGPGGSREAAFAEFLGAWFDRVEAIPLDELTAERARDFDVVVADWMSQFGNDGYPRQDRVRVPITLDTGFTKPVVAMSYVGPRLRPNHKLEWL